MRGSAMLKMTVASLLFAQIAMPAAASVTLSSAQGGVFVARDGMVSAATPGTQLRAGDRVFTRRGGSARLSSAGCAGSVGSGSAVTVGASACASTVGASLAAPRPMYAMYAQNNDTQTDAGSTTPVQPAATTSEGGLLGATAGGLEIGFENILVALLAFTSAALGVTAGASTGSSGGETPLPPPPPPVSA